MATKDETSTSKSTGSYCSFIVIDEDSGKFALNPKALDILKKLKGDMKVIAVAGMQRTGKSFLLNQLVSFDDKDRDTATKAFEVGSTVQTCTKGINMYVRTSAVDGSSVIFLDTEGFGSTVRSQAFDIKLFSLALLLSSYFIYNSRGVIDASAIEDLSLVVQLTRHIHVKELTKGESDDGTHFSAHFPTFMWVVRDFALKLVDDEENDIDAREYMENALDSASEESDSDDAMMVSNMIRGFFTTRDCMTLVRPITDETKLQNLSEQPYASLREEFREQMLELQAKVIREARPKMMKGASLSGANLASLAKAYVTAINDGQTPTISTAWERVVQSQCQDAVAAAVALYETTIAKSCEDAAASASKTLSEIAAKEAESDDAVSLEEGLATSAARAVLESNATVPLEASEVTGYHERASEAAHGAFHEHLAGVLDGEGVKSASVSFRAKLNEDLRERLRVRRSRNADVSKTFCEGVAASLFADVKSTEMRIVADASEGDAADEGAQKKKDEEDDENDGRYVDRRSAALQKLMAYHKRATGAAFSAYADIARGPAKWSLFARFAANAALDPLVAATDAFSHDSAMQALAQRNALSEKAAELERAAQQKVDDAAAFETERETFKRQFERLTTDAEAERGKLQSLVDAKSAEVERLWQQNERNVRDMRDANDRIEKMREKALKVAEEHRAEMEKLRQKGRKENEERRAEIARLQEAHRNDLAKANKQFADAERATADAKHDALTQKVTLEARIAEVERMLVSTKQDAEREKQNAVEAARRHEKESGSSAATRKLESELKEAREHQKLMREHLEVTKDLLKAKNSQVIEVEYQWAAAKAKLAQAQLDREELDADVCVLEDLVTKLKLKAIKTSRDLRSLRLTQKQTQRFYSL